MGWVTLAVSLQGDKLPLYGETLEEAGRFRDDPSLPFNAFGTLAMARGEVRSPSSETPPVTQPGATQILDPLVLANTAATLA